jgi:hypothetical protein
MNQPSADAARSRRAGFRPRINVGSVALVASVLATFSVAAVILLNVRGPDRSATPAARVSLSTARHEAEKLGIDPSLLLDFKILWRSPRPTDLLTGVLAQIAIPDAPINGDSRPTSLGLRPKLAREQNLQGTAFRAWLIPGRHGLCWAAEYRTQVLGAFCSSFSNPATTLAPTGGDASVKTATGLITIGLVTNRVRELELIGSHGQRSRVPISDGFYTVAGPGNDLIATTATGSERLPAASSEIVLNTLASHASVPTPTIHGSLVAQIPLRPPSRHRTPAGIVYIYKSTQGYGLSLDAAGVRPASASNAYAVWLYNTPHEAQLLGFIAKGTARAGNLTTHGALPSHPNRYNLILVTLETNSRPTTPGKVVLEGPLSLPHNGHR